MADSGSSDDRLPWLESSPAARRTPAAARRARRPLLVLLALFGTAAVAVLAFVVGRGTAPVATVGETPQRQVAEVNLPPPVAASAAAPATNVGAPMAPTLAPVVAEPAPTQVVRASPPTRWHPRYPHAAVHHAVPPQRLARATPRVVVHRAAPVLARYAWPAPAPVPSGRVIQLGAFYTGQQTMDSWLRLKQAYPHLATLPRKVMVIPATRQHPRFYRLRIGAPSTAYARTMCDNLHRIGRGCIVV